MERNFQMADCRTRQLRPVVTTVLWLGTALTFCISNRAVAQDNDIELAPIVINADKPNTKLTPVYPGGQVAAGAGLGILGNRSDLDSPFSTRAFTSQLAEDQQARALSDVMINDSSVSQTFPRSSYRDVFYIRGFSYFTYNILLDGMPGMVPKQRVLPQNYDRFEVLKGPDTFLNGAVVGSAVGGSINVVPKYAEDDPTHRMMLGYSSDAQPSASVDLGRRFGSEGQFGARTNLTFRDGDLAVDDYNERLGSAVLGLDYQGDRLRLFADLGYQKNHTENTDWAFRLAPGASVPDAPDGKINLSQDWAGFDTEDYFTTLRGEYDFSKVTTGYFKLGYAHTATEGTIANPSSLQSNGDFTVGGNSFPSGGQHRYAETGVKNNFSTGPVHHETVLAASLWDLDLKSGFADLGVGGVSNIYDPVAFPGPTAGSELTLDEFGTTSKTRFSSLIAADTLGFADDQVQLTLGGRSQRIKAQGYDAATGNQKSSYDETRLTPAAGVTWHLRPDISIYGNYVESLQQGPTAPAGTVNQGDVFAPVVSRQVEVGVKYDAGSWGGQLAYFNIRQPSGVTDPVSNVYAVDGEQENRGVELNIQGELKEGLRAIGGITVYDADVSGSAGGTLDGNRPVGVPDWQSVVGLEQDISAVPGFTVSGRVIHTGEQYADASNTQKLPDWTRLDVGARYIIDRPDSNPIVVRLSIENVLGLDYWASASSGQVSGISRGAPRTFLVSTSFDF